MFVLGCWAPDGGATPSVARGAWSTSFHASWLIFTSLWGRSNFTHVPAPFKLISVFQGGGGGGEGGGARGGVWFLQRSTHLIELERNYQHKLDLLLSIPKYSNDVFMASVWRHCGVIHRHWFGCLVLTCWQRRNTRVVSLWCHFSVILVSEKWHVSDMFLTSPQSLCCYFTSFYRHFTVILVSF